MRDMRVIGVSGGSAMFLVQGVFGKIRQDLFPWGVGMGRAGIRRRIAGGGVIQPRGGEGTSRSGYRCLGRGRGQSGLGEGDEKRGPIVNGVHSWGERIRGPARTIFGHI